MYCMDTRALCPTRGRQTPLEITLKSSTTQQTKKNSKKNLMLTPF